MIFNIDSQNLGSRSLRCLLHEQVVAKLAYALLVEAARSDGGCVAVMRTHRHVALYPRNVEAGPKCASVHSEAASKAA